MDIFEGIELSDEQKAAIQEKIAGSFVAKDEFEAVNSKREELLAEAKRAKEAKRQAEEAAEAAALEASKKSGDIEGITASYEAKLKAMQDQLEGFAAKERQQTIGSIADGFISQHVVDDPLIRDAMRSEITKRLDVRDGKPVVLDTEGHLTALSTDDLFSEIRSAGKYKPHLVASKASGSGAAGANGSSAASGNLAEKSLAECKTPEERRAVLEARLSSGAA